MEMEALFSHLKVQESVEAGELNVSSNFTWIYTDFLHRYSVLSISYLTVLSMFMVTGTVGNILVIGAVLVSRRLRTTGNIFILNLALADLFLTSIIDPFSIIGVVKGPSFFSEKKVLCYVIAGMCLPSCITSLWTMGAIAVNRYIFLCHNQSYNRIFTRRKTILMCIALWITGYMVMEFPAQMGWVKHTFDMKKMMCSYNRLTNYPHIVFFVSFAIACPLVIVSGFYLKIFLYVVRTRNRLELCASPDQSKSNRRERHSRFTYMDRVLLARKREAVALAKTLFLVFLVFFICWTPYAVVILTDKGDHWSRVVYVITIQMAHANASLNSIIYAASNRHFRRGYAQFLTKFCPKLVRRVIENWMEMSHPQKIKQSSWTINSHSTPRIKRYDVVYNVTFKSHSKPDKDVEFTSLCR